MWAILDCPVVAPSCLLQLPFQNDSFAFSVKKVEPPSEEVDLPRDIAEDNGKDSRNLVAVATGASISLAAGVSISSREISVARNPNINVFGAAHLPPSLPLLF